MTESIHSLYERQGRTSPSPEEVIRFYKSRERNARALGNTKEMERARKRVEELEKMPGEERA